MLAVTAPTVDTPTTLGFGAIGNTTLNRTLVVLTSALSLLGAIVIIITYYAWKDMQSTSRKILVYISGADCVVVSSFMFGAFLPPNTNSPACTAQSLLYTTANLCSIFWTTFMAVFLYISIARKKPKLADKMFYMFHAIGWGVPVLIACIALQAGVLGNDRDIYSSAWCWIKVHDSGKNVEDNYIMWMLVTGKAWEVLVFILILIFYGLLKCHLRQEVYINERNPIARRSLEAAKRFDKKLTLVPVIFLCLRSCGMMRFAIYSSSSVHESKPVRNAQEVLIYFQGVFESAQGLTNFLMFCLFTKKFQVNMKRTIHRYCNISYCPVDLDIQNTDDSQIEPPSSEENESSSIFGTSDFGPKYSYHTVSQLNSKSNT